MGTHKTFIEDITPVLCRVYNYALSKGDPPKTWSEAIIAVIYKKGKDPSQCRSFGLFLLLLTDLKLFGMIIQKHIGKLIHPDQTGFIPGRQITKNIRRII